MKSLKSIAGIFACASILLTGCEKEFKAGEDTTKPVPTDLQYDVEYSRPDTMAVLERSRSDCGRRHIVQCRIMRQS